MSSEDDTCPTCGRPSPAQFRARLAARSRLIREAHDLGLNTQEAAELICGIRTFPAPQDANG
jgi:hypothetical protein